MMTDGDLKQRVDEIAQRLAEGDKEESSGALVVVVAGVLSAAGLMVGWLGVPPLVVWPVHNVALWVFVLAWWEISSRREGRRRARGRMVLRLWAVVTLAIWISILGLHSRSGLVVPLWLSMGVFGTGLLDESGFTQALGIVWMIVLGVLAFLGQEGLPNAAVIASLVVAPAIWAAGLFLLKRAE